MNVNKIVLSAIAALAITPAVAFADTYPVTVSVEASVPAANGMQISPVNGWDATTQRMSWDMTAAALRPIRQQIDVKSTNAIEAYLTNAAVLTSGAESLDMAVAVHGKTLGVGAANKVELLTDVEAAAGRRVDLQISTNAPAGGYKEGTYVGQVYMMFESTP